MSESGPGHRRRDGFAPAGDAGTGAASFPSLLFFASGLILGAMFPSETRAASSTMAGGRGKEWEAPACGNLIPARYWWSITKVSCTTGILTSSAIRSSRTTPRGRWGVC